MKKILKGNIIYGLKNSDARLFDFKDINSDYIQKDRRLQVTEIIKKIRFNIEKLRLDL